MRNLLPTSLTLCALLLAGQAALAEVYQYRDAEGRIYLTDKPMQGAYRLIKRFSLPGTRTHARGDSWAAMRQRRDRFAPMIEIAAREQRLRPALVHAVVRAESAYRADAVSHKGAVGLMQLMPATAARLGVSDSYDPQQNLRGGSRYLRQLLELFDEDLRLTLAAYNAGENAVIEYGHRVPPYPETQRYVEKVLAFYDEYRSSDKLAQR